MTTPEGKVKAGIRKLLAHPRIWSFWPVPSGYQAATLDILCAVRVRDVPVFFAIEAKRAGKALTERQKACRADMIERVNAKVFRVRDEAELEVLRQWIEKVLGAKE